MKKTWINILIAVIIGVAIGSIIIKCTSKKPEAEIIEKEIPVYYQDLIKIHDLEKTIEEREKEINSLKKKTQEIKEVVIIEKEEIKLLPPDSGVLVLRENLETYTEQKQDSLPSLYGDSLILLDNKDLGNINSLFLDYWADEKIISTQNQIIFNDSLQKTSYDSICKVQHNIQNNLESALKKERRKKNILIGTTIGASVAAIIIGVLCYGRSGH